MSNQSQLLEENTRKTRELAEQAQMDNQRLLQQVQSLTQENQALLGEKNQL